MTVIRVGIAILVAFSVLAHGAVETWSTTILETGAALLFLAWGLLATRRGQIELRWNWLYLPLLGLGAWALAQELFGLSAYPYGTKIELLKAGAYFLLFFLTIESFRTVAEWKSFAWFLMTLGFVVSLLAIVQYFTFNGKLYWIRPLPQGVVPFGPFVNHNHFAGFVELTAPVGLAMLMNGSVRREKLPVVTLLSVVPMGALALSASRAGIASFLIEFVLLIFLTRRKEKGKAQLWMASGLAVLAGFLAVWLGLGLTVERFEHLTNGELSRNRRVSLYRDTWRIIRDHPWRGTGLGTLQTVFPRYESYYDGLIVDHAHNDYLELVADTGLIGGACMLGFIALLGWRGLSNVLAANDSDCRSLYAGALVGCAGLLLHSFVDFNFHIPSNALLFFLLAAMATSSNVNTYERFPQASLHSQDFPLDPSIAGP